MKKEFESIYKKVNKIFEMAEEKDMLDYDCKFIDGEFRTYKYVYGKNNCSLNLIEYHEGTHVIKTSIYIDTGDFLHIVDYYTNDKEMKITKYNIDTRKMSDIKLNTFINHLNKFKNNLKIVLTNYPEWYKI